MNSAPVSRISRHFSIQHLWAVVVIAGVFIFVNTHPIRPHDFWWHLAIGRDILAEKQIPVVDNYSYTAFGEPYQSYQHFWLMEIGLYMIYRTGGPPLIILFQSLLVMCTYLIILVTCLMITRNWRLAAFGAGFAAVLGMNDWNVRPQTITFLFGAVILFLIQRYQYDLKRHWTLLIPLVMVFWVNTHGSFLLGLFLLFLWTIQESWYLVQAIRSRQKGNLKNRSALPFVVFIASLLACLVNPSGLKVLSYPLSLLENSVIQNLVVEWAPPTFSSLGGSIFLVCLLFTAGVLALSPRRVTFFQGIGFLTTAYLSIRTSRGIIWFGLVGAIIVVDHSRAILSRLNGGIKAVGRNQEKTWLNILLLAGILVMVVVSMPWFKDQLPMPIAKAGLISHETPIQATNYILKADHKGRIFHAMSYGSYLIWAAYPKYQVYVDGRIELYPLEIWQDYLQISNAQGDWESKLQDYQIRILMLSPVEQPALVKAVEESDRWVLVFEDDVSLVFFSN